MKYKRARSISKPINKTVQEAKKVKDRSPAWNGMARDVTKDSWI